MGLFGGDDDPNQRTNDLMEQQIRENQAELEAKRQNLYREKLDIIKGQGAQTWQADRNQGADMGGSKPNINWPKWFKGFEGF